ncbi:UrcA family protein [Novosphingobium olei]|uniref:UrcA family protein n=1 Tax=Novosphingobium olei TaxID=2728851 RepID=A0A7Y0BST5_9SPHN|nr:UrcA family protein [Novosphingobium olei]NML95808.1 UrcA family protein [Novosphingobium olei]BEV02140.1 UrcA family protein [Novosphingobium olei]
MTRSIFRPLATVAALAIAASATTAFAQGADTVTRTKVVSFSDLDLASAQGQAQLDARLRRAAGAVCNVEAGPHPLAEKRVETRCYNEALKSARASYAMVRQQPAMAR